MVYVINSGLKFQRRNSNLSGIVNEKLLYVTICIFATCQSYELNILFNNEYKCFIS